ncbi:endonuclease/exonuclease/phosphatase family protein [Convivina intestini]|nr:endonuclease/exonuclease/phosphatase family protein [Convivina intestini]CAH1852641.1 hypothetical protein R078131_00523 [Convivina intestini]
MKILKKIGIGIGALVALLIILIFAYGCYMQANYYRIADHKQLTVHNNQSSQLQLGKQYTATTYNVGFGAYNHDFDFFMDTGELKDGTKVKGHRGTAISKQAVLDSTNGVIDTMKAQNADFMFFQEIDTNSTRSKHVPQVSMLEQAFNHYASTFAVNFHTAFIAVPIYDPHGIANSGLLSLSRYQIDNAERRKYPVSSSFISKFVDLDRCFSVMRMPVKDGKDLVMINSHMSAYDKGGKMRKAQMKLLNGIMEKEYQAGNYVIVGGDFNFALGQDMIMHFANGEKRPEWVSDIDQSMLPEGITMVKAQNRETVPTVRGAEMKYDPKVNYMTICDGFFVSNNVKATATDIDTDFRYADHNPVKLEFTLE